MGLAARLAAACLVAALPLGALIGAPGRRELTVVFSGEMKGYLSPCGCTKPMLGGIARRGAAVRRLAARGPVVLVENGDLTQAEGRQDELKAETLADALGAMGYDAVGLGETDLALGAEFLDALAGRTSARMLCANARPSAGSGAQGGAKSAFAPSARIRRTIGGKPRDILIASVIGPGHRAEGFAIGAAAHAIRRFATDRAAVRILLFHGRGADAEALARAVPGFGLIVYAHGSDTSAPPVRVGRSTLVCAGTGGKYLGTATLDAEGTVVRIGSIALGEGVGSDARVESIRRAYLARVASENLLDLLPRAPLRQGESFAGSAVCAPCHAAAQRVWSGSGHARAMATLRKVGQDRDPECVPCHAVGVGSDGGYLERRNAALAHVGCENCHGPSGRHVADPAVRPDRGGPKSCATCHVPRHSPGFGYGAYWSRIRH
jgi:hypothetical protein